ncbi:MAG: transketolase family protein [Clostridia bacterium]|nr:transketolase family protein [Clostridia bacterium]MBQ8268236.1 transketolase family protein [Clostridia bacterium]MBQ8269492.1 transketolase family protein [Clostridia bacterium]MBR2325539.1 transketolase family protein [Clostridia bacterium]
MAEKKATREAYGAALAALGEKHDFVVLDADLAAATKTGVFKKKFPERFFDCGIAEGNMMSVAAGIATTGKIPFVSTFAIFASGRAYEQVRNSIGYPHLNVKIGATHAGITVGEDGATHQANEDLALMRTIPGMTVICPADATEAYAATEAALLHNGPVYLRYGRFAVPDLSAELAGYHFEIGKGVVYKEGKDVTIVATGFMVHLAMEAAAMLAEEGIDAEVINIHTIKPLDAELVERSARKTGAVVTAEEHSVIGGLGGAVCEALSESYPCPVKRVGVEDSYGRSGKVPELLELYGLTAKNIAAKAKEAIAKK